MEIKFTSSLTAEDENRVAPELLRLVTTLLDTMSLAYAIRIETADMKVYSQSHPATPSASAVLEPSPDVPNSSEIVRLVRGQDQSSSD